MKKDRKTKHKSKIAYEQFSPDDTRYYGLWFHGTDKTLVTKIDPKRFQETTRHLFTEEQLAVINKRSSHYFHPAKTYRSDYACYSFFETIRTLEEDWEQHFKPFIDFALQRIKIPKQVFPGDYFNLQAGISGVMAAQTWASQTNWRNEWEYRKQIAKELNTSYAQFIHYMASRIEGTTVKVLTKYGMMDTHFDRNILYGGYSKGKSVKELTHFSCHDKLYCLWNFLKHNSQSTYDTLCKRFPEVLIKKEFKQGDSALYYIIFSEELVWELLDGCLNFFMEYCALIFDEDAYQAEWNFHHYFYDIVTEEIESIVNPLGLEWYDELD